MAIRRKLGEAKPAGGADRVWRVALARAARDDLSLAMAVTSSGLDRVSLAELLERLPERAFLGVLEGPSNGLGLIALSPEVLASMTEMQTTGRVSSSAPPVRKPTRTDAALVAGGLDAALIALEDGLAADADLVWAGGFRYGSFLEDARPLGLLLEDQEYRLLTATVVMADGMRSGQVALALPASGKGRVAVLPDAPDEDFSALLGAQVLASDAVLEAVMHRMTLPLSAVMGLKAGDLVPLPMAVLDCVTMEAAGRRLANGKLGQNRGMRAIRLNAEAPAATVVPLRAVG